MNEAKSMGRQLVKDANQIQKEMNEAYVTRSVLQPECLPRQIRQQSPPPTEDETWTAEEMNLLSMIHRRDRKILHLQEENRRLEMNVLQQGQKLREINAQVEDLKKQHEELERDKQCCCAPEPIVSVTSAPNRPYSDAKVEKVLEEEQMYARLKEGQE